MERISVLEIFRTFTKSELKKFSDFTHSPYFNKNSNVIKLYNIISKFAPKFDEEKLTKEFIWTQLYPGKNYNYGIISNLISELNKLALRYLRIEDFENSPLDRDRHLIGSFVSRGITNYASSKIHEIEKAHLNRDFTRTDLLLKQFYFNMWLVSGFKNHINKFHGAKINLSDIGKVNEETTAYFANFLLHTLFEIEHNLFTSHQQQNSFTKFFIEIFDDERVSKIIERLKEFSPIDYLILKTYHKYIFAKRKGATEKDYFEFKKLLFSIIGLMGKTEQRGLFYFLESLASDYIRNIGYHKVNIYEERLNIVRNIIDRELHITENGAADYQPLRACCFFSINLMDSKDTRIILNKYSNKVEKELRKYFVELCELTIAICEEDYTKALSLISTFTPIDNQDKLILRLLKVICFYELNYYEHFLLEKDSLKKFSVDNKFYKSYVLTLNKFYKFIETLFRLCEKFDITKFRALYKEVFSDMSSHKWLKNTLIKMKEEHGVKMKLLEMESDSLKKASTGISSPGTRK